MNFERIIEKDNLLKTKWKESYKILNGNQYIGDIVINEHHDMIILYKFEIFDQYRKSGLAILSLKTLIDYYHKKIRVAVDKKNHAAFNLYYKVGFKQVFRKYNWYWLELDVN